MNISKLPLAAGAVALAFLGSAASLHAQRGGFVSQTLTTDCPAPGLILLAAAASSPPANHDYYADLDREVYLAFDGGAAKQQGITLSDLQGDREKIHFDTGVRMDLALGHNITKNWAMELEMGLMANTVNYSYTLGTDYGSQSLVQMPLLLNVVFTQPLGSRCAVYVGAGGGGIFSQYADAYGDSTPSAAAWAYQAQAGLRVQLSEHWTMGLGYKLLGTSSYSIGSGVSYDYSSPTEWRSSGNLSQAVLLTFTCTF